MNTKNFLGISTAAILFLGLFAATVPVRSAVAIDPSLGLGVVGATDSYGATCSYPLKFFVTPLGILGLIAFAATIYFLIRSMRGREIAFLKKFDGKLRARNILTALFSIFLLFGIICFFAAAFFWFDLMKYFIYASASVVLFGISSLMMFILALVAPPIIVSLDSGWKEFYSILKYEARLGILIAIACIPIAWLLVGTMGYGGCRVYGI